MSAPTATMIAEHLAGWGAIVDVIEPAEVRAELLRISRELAAWYVDVTEAPAPDRCGGGARQELSVQTPQISRYRSRERTAA